MTKSLLKQSPIIALFSLTTYLTILLLSHLFYHLHHPNIINYAKQSWLMVFSKYVWGVMAWGLLAVLFCYVGCWGCDQGIKRRDGDGDGESGRGGNGRVGYWGWVVWKHRMLVVCIIVTLIVAHSYVAIVSVSSKHSALYQSFKSGNKSWPGWSYYYSDDYYSQTKQRLQQTRAKLLQLPQYEQMLLALKDINNGIYSTRSWLANHRFVYELLRIGCKLVGGLAVVGVWGVWVWGMLCGNRCGYRGIRVLVFGGFWVLGGVLGGCGEFVHSLVGMNSNPICLPLPNSGVVVITINQKSVDLISQLQLTLIQDPFLLYSNVCQNMQKYYSKPVQTDTTIVIHMFNMSFVGLMCIVCLEIVWMGYWRREEGGRKGNYGVGELEYNSIDVVENQ